MNTKNAGQTANELFEETKKSYEQAFKTGLKLQEESGKYWNSVASQGVSPQEWQKRMQSAAQHLIPQTQKSLEGCLKLIEDNSRTGLELLKKAAAVAQSTSVQEAQSKCMGFWEASMQALRDSAQAAAEANSKAIASWMDFLSTEATVRPAHKGAA